MDTFLTVLKAICIIVGMMFCMANFIPGMKGDKLKLRTAFFIFIGIGAAVIVITVLEFWMKGYYK